MITVADQVVAEEAFSLHPERRGRASLAEKGGGRRQSARQGARQGEWWQRPAYTPEGGRCSLDSNAAFAL